MSLNTLSHSLFCINLSIETRVEDLRDHGPRADLGDHPLSPPLSPYADDITADLSAIVGAP